MKKTLLLLLSIFTFITLLAQDITGPWNGTLDFGKAKMKLVFNVEATNGECKATMDSPDQGAKGIPVSKISFIDNELSLSIDNIRASYKGKLTGDSIVGVFTQGQNFPLTLKRGTVELTRPQEPKPPYAYHSENITINNSEANIKLAGTFTYPIIGNNFPVLILIAGSGGHNRDEEILGHKPFLVLSNYLTNNGIAVLRYDKRGIGKSEGKYNGAVTSADFAEDAYSALKYLETRKEIDPSRIGLIGHSEGGMIAFMLANKYPNDISFVVSMAGTGVSGKEISRMQSKDMFLASGGSESDALINQKLAMDMADIVEKNTDEYIQENSEKLVDDILPTEMRENPEIRKSLVGQLRGMSAPWWRFLLAHNPQEDLINIVCPVFALNGDKDVQVDANVNLKAIDENLLKAKSKKIKKYENLNHLFQTSETGSASEYARIEETIAPIVLKDITDWIKEVTK